MLPPNFDLWCLAKSSLVVTLRVENAQYGEEQVDDIQVERDSSRNLLFDVVVAHNHLSVHQDVTAEDQGRDDAISEFDLAVVGKERRHKSKQDQHPQPAKQIWYPGREVVFALAGKQAERDENTKGEYDRFENDFRICEGHYHRY